MSNIGYLHQTPQSYESRLIQFFMGLFGMKKVMEKKIVKNTYSKVPASIPNSIRRKYKVEVEEFKVEKVLDNIPHE